jgi:protein SCO1/2
MASYPPRRRGDRKTNEAEAEAMSARALRLLAITAAFLGGLVLCLGLIVLVEGRSEVTGGVPAAAIGGPFRLIDQDGKPFTDQDLKGKSFLVFFGFTHCPDICPTTLFEISEIMSNLGRDADRTAAVFITVDPERDTPATMKDYMSSFDPRLHGLTGDPADIAAVAKAYRVYYRKVPLDGGDYTMDHTAIVYLMDKQGRFVSPFNMRRSAEDAAAELRKHL